MHLAPMIIICPCTLGAPAPSKQLSLSYIVYSLRFHFLSLTHDLT